MAPKILSCSCNNMHMGGFPTFTIVLFASLKARPPIQLHKTFIMTASSQTLVKKTNLVKITMLCLGCPPHSERSVLFLKA
jgi:hypothetical protein